MGKSLDYSINYKGVGAGGNKSSAPSQREKFIQAARELGCDEDEAAFDESLRKVAGSPGGPKRAKRRGGEGADPKAGTPGVKGG